MLPDKAARKTTRYELEIHAYTAEKLLTNPEWIPSRLLWQRLTGHLKAAVAAMPEDQE